MEINESLHSPHSDGVVPRAEYSGFMSALNPEIQYNLKWGNSPKVLNGGGKLESESGSSRKMKFTGYNTKSPLLTNQLREDPSESSVFSEVFEQFKDS